MKHISPQRPERNEFLVQCELVHCELIHCESKILLKITCNCLIFSIHCDNSVLLSPHIVTYGLMSSLWVKTMASQKTGNDKTSRTFYG